MILKEAYRYQNFLTNLINNAQTYLGNMSFVMTTTQKHMKSKANPEKQRMIIWKFQNLIM